MIKVIIEHYISKSDINGNSYSKSLVTNCTTHEQIAVSAGHNSNVWRSVRHRGYRATEIYEVFSHNIPIRQFNKINFVNKSDNLDCLTDVI